MFTEPVQVVSEGSFCRLLTGDSDEPSSEKRRRSDTSPVPSRRKRSFRSRLAQGRRSNKDYTPFSRTRDKLIAASCSAHGIAFRSFSDALLVEPSSFGKSDGTPYTIYTPFFKRAALLEVKGPISIKAGQIGRSAIPPLSRDSSGQMMAQPRDAVLEVALML
jgi:deoxyribodipyrimidine photolyase